jgi:methylenetetrahydrofolate reductase (NADH)
MTVIPVGGGLRAALAGGRFVVTAELGPPRGPDTQGLQAKAALLRDWVDAANVTDNQGANVRLSALAGCVLVQQAGVDPVLQMTTRDRNRIGLQSDLIGAAALGLTNVLLLTGDHPKFGDHPEAAPVFDIDSIQLLWTAKLMRDEGRLLSGRRVEPPPDFFLGAVENPFSPPVRFRARRLGKKVAAGAQFVQTQFVFDVEAFARWMVEVRDLGLHERCKIIAGVGPIRTPRALEHMRSNVPGLSIPQPVVDRLSRVAPGAFADEGIRLCAEIIEQVREIPGVAGVHVMAFGHEEHIPTILRQAGIPQRTPENAH